jgi:hypothetical protein
MKKNKALNFIKFSLISFLALSFLGIMPVQAKEDPIVFEPQIGIPGFNVTTTMNESSTTYIAQMIKAFYDYGLAIGGILAAVVLMAGGLIWLTSAGSSDKITQAKGLIIGSLSGIGLLFGAWIILNTINPYLLEFKIKEIRVIEKTVSVCCEYNGGAEIMYGNACKDKNGTIYENNMDGIYIPNNNHCQIFSIGCNIRRDCDDKVKWCFDTNAKITTRENCDGSFKMRYEYKDSRCSTYTECKNKTANCQGVLDGERCQETGSGEELDGYCYYSMCFLGLGKEMESCGTEAGAYCSSFRCSQLGQVGEEYLLDNSNARDCLSSLYCCYKNNE